MFKSFLVLAATSSMALAGLGGARADHSWEDYHWARAANPFTVTLVDRLEPAWDPYLPPVSSDWSRSNVLDTRIQAGSSDLVSRLMCLPPPGVVVTCNANYGPNLWLGLATIYLDGDHIIQGSVQVNDFYFSLPQYNNSAERRHVLCQEVGHTFGLAHQSESGESLNTCMDYYNNTSDSDTKSTTPNSHDYEQLSQIYSHLDGSTSGGGGSRKGKGGCAAHKTCNDGAGAHEHRVVYRVGDLTVIQFIYWI